MNPNGRVALMDMHWFYVSTIRSNPSFKSNLIKYLYIELYECEELKRAQTWILDLPSQYRPIGRDNKTINYVQDYIGVKWNHRGEQLTKVCQDVQALMKDVTHVLCQGTRKRAIFKSMFQLPNLNVEAIQLYETVPAAIDKGHTIATLREKLFEKFGEYKAAEAKAQTTLSWYDEIMRDEIIYTRRVEATASRESTLEEDELMLTDEQLLAELDFLISD